MISHALNQKKIAAVFRDALRHKNVGQLIRRFSTNRSDIRTATLDLVDLSNRRRVLELGCAFGAFTEALKGRLNPSAKIMGIDILPEYRDFFLEACRRAGYEGEFSSAGVDSLKSYPPDFFDLVICSYALYFFPHAIPDIARLSTPDGIFITITHTRNDMRQLIVLTKRILRQQALLQEEESLPIETVLANFSAENGRKKLKPFFRRVEAMPFKNKLIFEPQEIDYFLEYFHFKKSFFLVGTKAVQEDLASQILQAVCDEAAKGKKITMSKDDMIFISLQPVKPATR